MVKVKCSNCNKDFERRKQDIKRRNGRPIFCSSVCYSASKKAESKYECLNCNDIIISSTLSKFCSHRCRAIYTNSKRKKIINCLSCGKETNNKIFCSYSCNKNFTYNIFIKNWLDGKEDGVLRKGLEVSRYIRRYMKITFGEKCSICFWAEVNPKSGKIPIELDHIDGNAENNKLDNLRLLCPNCHSLTSTYGALNRGNGRKARYAALV